MNTNKNILFIAFIVMVALISCPVIYKISNRILEQTSRNSLYSLINKATTLESSNEEINIYKVKDNKIVNIITNEEKDYKNNEEGFIITKGSSVAFSLKNDKSCIIKDFTDTEITKSKNCDSLKVAGEIFSIKDKKIKIKSIEEIPEIKIETIDSITSTYKILDQYNNEMVKENIINDGTYKILYTFKIEDTILFQKEYKLIIKK